MHRSGRARRRPAGGEGDSARAPRRDRSTAVFALWTGVSRVGGLVREMVSAAIFGTQGAINAFVIAFAVPNLLRSLVADSALSAAFIPVYTELQEKGRHAEARRLAGALVGVIATGLGVITILAMLTAPWVMPLFAPGLSPELVDETVRLAQIMFPIVVLLGLTGLVAALLQAGGRFGETAFAPVLWNIVIIAILVVVTPLLSEGEKITAYAVAIVVGTLVQLLYLMAALRGSGPFPFSLGWSNPHVRRVLVLMAPVTLGLGLINVNLVIDGIFASLVSDDSPRAIDAAFRLYLLPQGMFSVAISTVLFPAISRLAARDDRDGLRATVAGGLRQIFFLLLPASAFLLVLGEPVVRLVYERGAFDEASTSLTATALVYFAIGLAFNGASLLVIRAFFGLQSPGVATRVAALGVALNVGLNAALYRPLGTGGIPLSTSITSIVTFLVLARLLERELEGIHRRWILDGVARIAAAAAVAGLAGWAAWRTLDDALGRSTAAQIVAMGAALAAATAAHLAAAQAFELRELRALIRLRRA